MHPWRRERNKVFHSIVFLLGFALVALACNLTPALPSKANTIIVSPPSGSEFQAGDDVQVFSVSNDSQGVARVELLVDGRIVETDNATKPQEQFPLIQTWQATEGNHTIVVQSYNARNEAINPTGVLVHVVAPSPSSIATPNIAAPGNVPPPTPLAGNPSLSPSGACTDSAAFIADVTVPDGTTVAPGTAINKTWRLANNGTCNWGDGYQFVFVSGEAMTSATTKPVPSTAAGARADLSVAMTAPTATGSHSGGWRMRNSNGVLFGPVVTVKITVPAPTAAAAPVQSGPCNGTPVISSFGTNTSVITWGGQATLRWGPVTNADSADIDQGIGSVAAGPEGGFVQVSPSQTTNYTLNAHCGLNTVQKIVTIYVPFAITSVVGSVSPTSGACTQTFSFQFTISVNTAGTVYWKRERSDGAADPAPGSYTFDNPGSYTVPAYTWLPTAVSGTHTYGMQLHTTSPTDVTSNQATFTVTCP